MFGTGIKTIMSSALVAATMLAASAPTANAGSLEIGFGGPNGVSIQSVGYNDHKRKWGHRRGHGKHGGYGGHRRHGGYSGYGRHNYGCSPHRAVRKAWNMGLNHPHVKRVGKRHIVVRGGYRGARARVVFSRYGGCHVMNFERRYW